MKNIFQLTFHLLLRFVFENFSIKFSHIFYFFSSNLRLQSGQSISPGFLGEKHVDFHQLISSYRLYKNTSILINSIHLTGSFPSIAFASPLLLFTIILNLDFFSLDFDFDYFFDFLRFFALSSKDFY